MVLTLDQLKTKISEVVLASYPLRSINGLKKQDTVLFFDFDLNISNLGTIEDFLDDEEIIVRRLYNPPYGAETLVKNLNLSFIYKCLDFKSSYSLPKCECGSQFTSNKKHHSHWCVMAK